MYVHVSQYQWVCPKCPGNHGVIWMSMLVLLLGKEMVCLLSHAAKFSISVVLLVCAYIVTMYAYMFVHVH